MFYFAFLLFVCLVLYNSLKNLWQRHCVVLSLYLKVQSNWLKPQDPLRGCFSEVYCWILSNSGREERVKEIQYQEVQSADRSTVLPGLHSNKQSRGKIKKKSSQTCLATGGMEERERLEQKTLLSLLWLTTLAGFVGVQTYKTNKIECYVNSDYSDWWRDTKETCIDYDIGHGIILGNYVINKKQNSQAESSYFKFSFIA